MSAIILLFSLMVVSQPQGLSIADFLETKCREGDQRACERFEILKAGLVKQQRLANYARAFAANLDTQGLMLDEKKPNLAAVYPLVMHNFSKMESEAGEAVMLSEDKLTGCAEHYHNHWLNRKLWWPALDSGQPDWESIYTFVVDHYYGFCLKT